MNLETLLLISVVLLSFGYAGYGLLRLMRLLRAQAPVHYPTRNKAPLRYRLVLRKFFFRKDPIHLIFLWGFLTLALDMVGQNLALVSVTLALCYAMYRRYLVRPESLGQSRSANILVGFTASLIVFVFLAKVTHHAAFYWIYRIMILGFIAYLPNSRHLHLLTATPNLFFQSLKKPTPTTASVSGAAKITDLSWKDALDTLSCSECGKCQEACPAHNTLKPLTPKMLMLDLQENFLHQEPTILSKKITEPTIWSCTFCKACEEACPNGIEHTPKILDIRRDITTTKKRVPEELATVYRNLETYGSPWAVSPAARLSWADGLGVKTIKQEKTELLLWVGCAGAFDERYRQTLRSIAKLLKKAGVKFSVLGEEEQCTGDVARRTGNEVLFQKLAKENIQKFNQYGIRKILTACPHCFHTLKNDYPAFGGNFEVEHHTSFFANLLSEGILKPSKGRQQTVTYHDSCYLSRWNEITKAPRDILRSLPGAHCLEMKDHGAKSLCCGAGGGHFWLKEKTGKRINHLRADQAITTRASTVATSCPFCMTMLEDALKAQGVADKVRVADLAELLDEATS